MTARGQAPGEAALAYAGVGWPVFPCNPGSKQPATSHGFYDASTDERQIRDWWRRDPERNVAIATGAPGPDVVDVDVHKDGSGFASFNRLKRAGLADGYKAVVRTPSGGLHLYYEGTDQHSGRLPEHHLDFRSRGGYIVAPPSQTVAGSYIVVQHSAGDGSTVSWDAITGRLTPPREAAPAATRQPRGEAGTSLDRLAAWVAARQAGDRNFPLFYAARQAHLSGQLDGDGVERLVGAALRSGLRGGEREARRTIASAQRSGDRDGGCPHPFAQAGRQLEAG
jgi:hypothetical protein